MTFRADLHCHSVCSDGSDTPLELLIKAKEVGLSALSITDHDTIEAYTPEIFASAVSLGIRLLPGIELSTEWKDNTVHVLGYGFDLTSQPLLTFIEELQNRRNQRNRSILQKLEAKKMVVTEEELAALVTSGIKKTIGRPHIAELMVKKGYVKSFREAFDGYLREGACCYVSGFKFTPMDAIQVIREAKGKAVLAHPHFIKPGNFLTSLIALPFDGIECYYGTLLPHQETPWINIAKKRQWIATGGSDYHGALKPQISLGCSWVDEATFNCFTQIKTGDDGRLIN